MKIRHKIISLILVSLLSLSSCQFFTEPDVPERPSLGGGNISMGSEAKRLTPEEDKIAVFEDGTKGF